MGGAGGWAGRKRRRSSRLWVLGTGSLRLGVSKPPGPPQADIKQAQHLFPVSVSRSAAAHMRAPVLRRPGWNRMICFLRPCPSRNTTPELSSTITFTVDNVVFIRMCRPELGLRSLSDGEQREELNTESDGPTHHLTSLIGALWADTGTRGCYNMYRRPLVCVSETITPRVRVHVIFLEHVDAQ